MYSTSAARRAQQASSFGTYPYLLAARQLDDTIYTYIHIYI